MMKFKFMLHMVAACAFAALAVACSNEDGFSESQSGGLKTITLTAHHPGYESDGGQAGTRIAFDIKGKAYWHAGDTIGVWSYGEKKFKPFILVDGAGTGTASFKGEVVDSAGCVVYPYNPEHRGYSGLKYYELPSSYTYESVDQTLFPEDKKGNSFRMPMVGTITNGVEVAFKHVGAVLCVRIDELPSDNGEVIVYTGENVWKGICGTSSLKESESSPELNIAVVDGYGEKDLFNLGHASCFVKVNFSNAKKGSPGVFYIPVPPNSYHLAIGVNCGGKSSLSKDSCDVKRGMLQVIDVKTDYKENCKVVNGHMFIDLGLPSGTLWAETNLDADVAADYGSVYEFGRGYKASKNYEILDSVHDEATRVSN